jgi:predicted Holliday junction resolvase-like endonuclease
MDDFSVLLLVVATIIIVWLWSRTSSLDQELTRTKTELSRVSSQIQREARALYDTWRNKEYDTVKKEQEDIATREAQVKLEQWRVDSEAGIRADARQRSQSVIVGKVTEHLVPYFPEFQFNPKDARFIGSPVDFIVFDGLDDDALGDVVFVEVKTGTGSLTKRERQVRDAVLDKRVRWEELRTAIAPTDLEVTEVGESGIAQGISVASVATTDNSPRTLASVEVACPRCGAKKRISGLEILNQIVRCDSCQRALNVTRLARMSR